VIERNVDFLTKAEVKDHWVLVLAAMRKEVKSFEDLGVFELALRSQSKNNCSSRWILRWKLVTGSDGKPQKVVKARLVIRGYEDRDYESSTFASTTSRWGQRVIVSLSVENKWKLYTLDIGTAFLQGLTYSQISTMSELPEREVSFDPPKGSEFLIRELPKFKTYNPVQHVLRLLKSAYGLRDAPKAWRTALDRCLKKWGMIQIVTDAGIYCKYFQNKLILCLSAHVDDLKVCGTPQAYAELKEVLEKDFGKLTEKCAFESELEHCGIIHQQHRDYSIVLHQNHYVSQLRPAEIPLALIDKPEHPLSQETELFATFQALLGCVGWTAQTRPDGCVYISALQRATSHATVGHLKKLNKLLKYLRTKPCGLTYRNFGVEKLKCLCISDSAFRREDPSCLAMRGAMIGRCEDVEGKPGGVFHPLEFFSRRQRKITRSTFAAETNAFADSIEISRVITQTFTAIQFPTESMHQLIEREETGRMALHLHGVVDCKSLFDHLASDETQLPSESSLILVLAGLKELLRCHSLKATWWINTHCMLADGLNKGLISRKALRDYGHTGVWEATGAMKKHFETSHKPIVSCKQDM